MPIFTLRFTLPAEQAEFDAARMGGEALRVLREIDQRCRSRAKYDELPSFARELAEEIRGMIRDSRERLLD